MEQATGYFAREFDKTAPAPGVNWTGEEYFWLADASQKGWVVKKAPQDAKAGALLVGFDKPHNNIFIGLVRDAGDGKISYEKLDDAGKVIRRITATEALEREIAFYGYIWPVRTQDTVQQISMGEAMEAWQDGGALFVDVRAADKYRQGHIPGAVSIPLAELKSRLKEIPKDKKVLLICRSGEGSSQANLILQSYGFAGTYSVSGGMLEWTGSIEK
ncbi:MAG TPA: rhodanese-like domain-containing protein [Selenomonadales bacterium]|nr:rhodanese-like domain-containing protein [Selenomonadales bacterium]